MVARVTLAEIDCVRMSVADAVERFREFVLPDVRARDGYRGSYVLATPEGRGLVITFWDSEEAAAGGITSGHYAEQIEKFVVFFREPPGRENYEVVLADLPAPAGQETAAPIGHETP